MNRERKINESLFLMYKYINIKIIILRILYFSSSGTILFSVTLLNIILNHKHLK